MKYTEDELKRAIEIVNYAIPRDRQCETNYGWNVRLYFKPKQEAPKHLVNTWNWKCVDECPTCAAEKACEAERE